MQFTLRNAVLGMAALAVVLSGAPANAAQTAPKCLSGKDKCVSKKTACKLNCYAKAHTKNLAVDPLCLGKCEDKFDGGLDPTKGCFAKLEAKGSCLTTGDTAALEAKVDAFVADVVTELHPTATAGKCTSGKDKCVSKKAKCKIGCWAKAHGKNIPVDPVCLGKCEDKFDGGLDPTKGCFEKLEAKPPCETTDDTAALEAKVDAFVDDVVNELNPPLAGCVGGAPNGTKDFGEQCDPTAAMPDNQCPNVNNALYPCNASCTCNCPALVAFKADAADPDSELDTGWTGISHDSAVIGEGKITVTVSGCAGTGRPCGVCNLGGPVNNLAAGAGDLDDERCSGDTRIKCNVDGDCAGFGTCEIYFGSLLPLSAGGVSTCVENRVVGSLTGTANIENGQSQTTLNLNSRVWLGTGGDPINQPCPVCTGDATPNDGVAGGTCSVGAHAGQSCDINGTHPLGNTSLDCPITLNGAGTIANLPIPLQSTTGTATRTLSTANPLCRAAGHTTERCFCDTCDDAVATPCGTNADCSPGGICGGKRCVGGGNNGAPCTTASQCPAGFCQTPGTSTAPNQCNPPDGAPDGCQPDVGDEGLCADGPLDQNCAPPEAQRGCTIPTQLADCPITGTCVPKNRDCFLDNGVVGGQIVATGAPDAPVNDVSNPKLATIFCVGFTGSTSVNGTAGLPGPARLTLQGTAAGVQ